MEPKNLPPLKVTDDVLDRVAQALIPKLDVLAGKTVELPPPPAPDQKNPCAVCSIQGAKRSSGTLSRLILASVPPERGLPGKPVAQVRLLLCQVHRERLEDAANGFGPPMVLKGREVLAVNPTTVDLAEL